MVWFECVRVIICIIAYGSIALGAFEAVQKLRSEVNDELIKIERNVSTIDSVVDEKFKTLWMMINNK